MIYIHKTGSINRKESEELDVKTAWKEISPQMIRRTDRFIQLSLLGAYQAVGEVSLEKQTALYMASGQGNLAVFKRLRDQRYIHQQPPKPVDFINSLSNTSGFYVAQFFGLQGKNLNVSRVGFVTQTLLLLAQNDLELAKEKMVLLGGVDELQEPVAFTRKTLGLCDERALGEGSNWMLLSAEEAGALATIDIHKEEMDSVELKAYIEGLDASYKVAFGQRCSQEVADEILSAGDRERFVYEEGCDFYETAPLYALNRFVQKGAGKLVFVDTFNEKYQLFTVENLPRF